MNLLEIMKEQKIHNFVFSSSCTVYGEPRKLPVTERSEIQSANSPYGNTKRIAEEILKDIVVAEDLFKVIVLRYFNPIGAHESAKIGELPNGVPGNLVPFITQTAIGKREKLFVYGNDYDTRDGFAIRDYIHVVDLAQAHVCAVDRLLENKEKEKIEYFNLGSGKGSTVKEMIDVFEKVSGQKLNYEIAPRREGDVEEIYADSLLANKELSWHCTKTLEEAIQSAWKWENNNKKYE